MENSFDHRVQELSNNVFGNSLLRERILSYAILDAQGKLQLSNALSCRLVQQSWLDSVTKCCLKSKKNLLGFNVASFNLKHLAVWTSSCFRNLMRRHQVPPLKLFYFFDSKKYEKRVVSFFDCLRFCGPGLISLDLDVLSGIYQNENIPNYIHANQQSLSFPVLHHLSLHFSSRSIGIDINVEEMQLGVKTYNAWTETVQCILFGCQQLACINLKGFPMGFENLLLPTTIKSLDFAFQSSSKRLEKLVENNSFPNLTELCLVAPKDSPQGYMLVYRLLNKVRDTLKKLKLLGSFISNQDIYQEPILIELPVMKRLATLAIRDRFHVLSNTESTLATVKTIKLLGVTAKMFKKYSTTSRFKSANKLIVEFLKDKSFLDQEVLTTDLAQMLYNGFAGVTSLVLVTAFNRDLQASIPYLFQNMNSLTELSIIVKTDNIYDCSSQFWNSVLVGMPSRMVTELESNREVWDVIQLAASKTPSIANLTELRVLKLRIQSVDDFPPLVLSDVLLEFVLLKMAKLHTLELSSVEVSSTMSHRWKQNGRVLKFVDPL